MYEDEDGTVALKDSIPFTYYYENDGYYGWPKLPLGLKTAETSALYADMNLLRTDGGRIRLLCGLRDLVWVFGDGIRKGYWALEYKDEEFRYVMSFGQTEGGSSGFVYTGYEFSEGLCTYAEVYYDENRDYLSYEDETVPMTAYFREHGLNVVPGRKEGIYDTEKDGRISPAFLLTCIPEKTGSNTYWFRAENTSRGIERSGDGK